MASVMKHLYACFIALKWNGLNTCIFNIVFDACKYSCVHAFYLLSYTKTGVLKHSIENAGTPILKHDDTRAS